MPLHFSPLTRRDFLTRTVAGGIAVLTAPWARGAEGAEEHWALLADTHIAEDPARIARNVNMAEHLRLAVAEVKALAPALRQVLVKGDCSLDHGEWGDYTTFLDLTKPLSEAGQTIHCLLGNHDERETFWSAMKDEAARARPLAGKHISVVESGVANWFLLDSLEVTLQTPGRLGEPQLEWLAAALDARPGKPALVMLHHDFLPRADGKK